MNRRDFLFLRQTPRGRTLELSCRALYMRTINADAPTSHPEGAVFDHEPWMGEPPADFSRADGDDWVRELEAQLREVDVLKLLDSEWLASTPISGEMAPLLDAFRSRGGRVELAKTQTS
jgi:hypothetical protein